MDLLAASTDVHPPDLTLHPTFPAQPAFSPATPDLDALFRHSGWLRDRNRTFNALRNLYGSSTRIDRFRHCGSNAWVIRNEERPDEYAVASDHCHDRFCRPCAAFRGHTIANNVAAYLNNREYRFLTITIKTTDLTLKQGVQKLYRCFGALRRSKLWEAKVRGGCAVCEVKPKDDAIGWHPHLHCIIEGKYLPLKALRKLWLAITGDSFIIDISYGRDPEKAARYVSKYITKPFDDGTTRTPHRLEEAIVALAGRRLVTTFGTWRGARLTVYRPAGTWVKICALCELRHHANKGDPEAAQLLRHLIDRVVAANDPPNSSRDPPEKPPNSLPAFIHDPPPWLPDNVGR